MRYVRRMKIAYGLGLSLTLAFGLIAGCDDDRNLGDLGPGQEFAGAGGQAAPETSGGADSAGAPTGGGTESGGGAESGGAESGGAGGAPAAECPLFFREAHGKPCSEEGRVCTDGAMGPCVFGNSLTCTNGTWWAQEAYPAPCGGAGGAEAGGAGGVDAGGAGAGGAGGNR